MLAKDISKDLIIQAVACLLVLLALLTINLSPNLCGPYSSPSLLKMPRGPDMALNPLMTGSWLSGGSLISGSGSTTSRSLSPLGSYGNSQGSGISSGGGGTNKGTTPTGSLSGGAGAIMNLASGGLLGAFGGGSYGGYSVTPYNPQTEGLWGLASRALFGAPADAIVPAGQNPNQGWTDVAGTHVPGYGVITEPAGSSNTTGNGGSGTGMYAYGTTDGTPWEITTGGEAGRLYNYMPGAISSQHTYGATTVQGSTYNITNETVYEAGAIVGGSTTYNVQAPTTWQAGAIVNNTTQFESMGGDYYEASDLYYGSGGGGGVLDPVTGAYFY